MSPVGSVDGGGVWARSPSLGGETSGAAGRGATELPAFVPADPSDRAETPGISAEAARDILDRLETPDPEKSPLSTNADASASEAVPEARRTLLVRGAPSASANAAELFLYRAFAPHGAVVSVRSTSGSNAAEHVVQFRRATGDGTPRAARWTEARSGRCASPRWMRRNTFRALEKTRAERITRDTYDT